MNILDLLREHDVPLKMDGEHHHTTPGWVQVDCPNCSPDSGRFRAGISIRWLTANCYACGRLRLGEVLAGLLGTTLSQTRGLLKGVEREAIPDREFQGGVLKRPNGIGDLLPVHRQYLKERGFIAKTLERVWGVRGIGRDSETPWSLYIPVVWAGRELSWTTRKVGNSGGRYSSAKPDQERVPIKNLLYGEDYCRDTVVICEGPTDVWRIGPGAVCTFGTTVTSAQRTKLKQYPRRVICFDPQPDAQRAAKQLHNELRLAPGETWNVLVEKAKDIGDSPKEAAEIRKAFLD